MSDIILTVEQVKIIWLNYGGHMSSDGPTVGDFCASHEELRQKYLAACKEIERLEDVILESRSEAEDRDI